jgi:hypothetical protein
MESHKIRLKQPKKILFQLFRKKALEDATEILEQKREFLFIGKPRHVDRLLTEEEDFI